MDRSSGQHKDVWTLGKVLDWTSGHFQRKGVDPARLCAEMVMAHVLGVERIRLYTDLKRPLQDDELTKVRDLVRRAAEHEPIQYLTGRAHFFSLEVHVTPDVLIPRPETETLVELAIQHVRHNTITAPRVLELCTGSGCVALALAHSLKTAEIVATDVSLPALDVARANAARLKLAERITFHVGDLFEALAPLVDRRPFDLLVANPPYIATAQVETLDRSVKDYEPRLALDGGPDGLDPHRRILKDAPARLVSGGRVLLEIAYDQEEPALWLAKQHDDQYDDAKVLRDDAKLPRVLSLRRR